MYICKYVYVYMYMYIYLHTYICYFDLFCIYRTSTLKMRFARSKVNNPDWNFEFVSDSNVLEYVSPEMLPDAYWTWHKPANKKDASMIFGAKQKKHRQKLAPEKNSDFQYFLNDT